MTSSKKNRHKAGRAAVHQSDLLKPKKRGLGSSMDTDAGEKKTLSAGALKRAKKAAEKAKIKIEQDKLRAQDKAIGDKDDN